MLDGIAGRIAVIPGMIWKRLPLFTNVLGPALTGDKLEVAPREKIHNKEDLVRPPHHVHVPAPVTTTSVSPERFVGPTDCPSRTARLIFHSSSRKMALIYDSNA
jgi:hypothetical protein